MCCEVMELPSLPLAAVHCRSPQGRMERLLWSLERVTGIIQLQGRIALHTYHGSHTAEGQLMVWEVK